MERTFSIVKPMDLIINILCVGNLKGGVMRILGSCCILTTDAVGAE